MPHFTCCHKGKGGCLTSSSLFTYAGKSCSRTRQHLLVLLYENSDCSTEVNCKQGQSQATHKIFQGLHPVPLPLPPQMGLLIMITSRLGF